MNEARPVRLQLSRRKGFDLQALSLATNGLPAMSVARPGSWGNHWTPEKYWSAGYGGSLDIALRHCVQAHRAWLEGRRHWAHGNLPPVPDLAPLRGKNLACWCPLDQPCHADALLALANNSHTPSDSQAGGEKAGG